LEGASFEEREKLFKKTKITDRNKIPEYYKKHLEEKEFDKENFEEISI